MIAMMVMIQIKGEMVTGSLPRRRERPGSLHLPYAAGPCARRTFVGSRVDVHRAADAPPLLVAVYTPLRLVSGCGGGSQYARLVVSADPRGRDGHRGILRP